MSPLAISLRFLQTQPDARLVELARAGHERAFEALVRRYRGPLLAYCRRVAPRGTAPEDILQQALLQAWKSISAGSEVREARAWLYRIVHNVAITALRASGELPENVVPGPGAPGVDQLVEQRMAAREALAGLAALPDLQRQVMVSTALDGASHEEIAAALGLSSGSVRGLIYRARSTLRAAAAAVIPAPVIEWALGDAGGAAGTFAGSGAAGLGALALKGGAILAVGAVGAIAGTAAIVAGHRPHRVAIARPSAVVLRPGDHGDLVAASPRALGASEVGSGSTGRNGRDGAGGHGDASARGEGFSGRGGGGHDGRGDGSRGGSAGPSSGSDGGRSGSGSDGGSSGGDHGTTTATSGSDGGGDHGATTATSGSDGGGGGSTTTTSGSDGGGSGGTTTTTSGSDGGGSGSGSSDGGSSGGGSSDGGTTTTTTTTTTSDGH